MCQTTRQDRREAWSSIADLDDPDRHHDVLVIASSADISGPDFGTLARRRYQENGFILSPKEVIVLHELNAAPAGSADVAPLLLTVMLQSR